MRLLPRFIEWEVVIVLTNGEVQLVTPGHGPIGNTTWLSDGSLVVQVMVASV